MYTNESKFQNEQDIGHLYIPKEDIFFAWLEKIDLKNDNIRVVTMSFPDYRKLLEHFEKILKEKVEYSEKNHQFVRVKGSVKREHLPLEEFDLFDELKSRLEILRKIDQNEIVCSNWDFAKVDGDWTLDGISMSLNNNVSGWFGKRRWKRRLRQHLISGSPFMKYLRKDYNNYIIVLLLLQFLIINRFMW